MRLLGTLTVALGAAAWGAVAGPAGAGEIADRVAAHGEVRCGAVARPGLAELDATTKSWRGLEVDICRAVAVARLGDGARIAFHGYETDEEIAGLKRGDDDIAFLTGTEIAENGIAGALVPGPPVFIEAHALLVPEATPAKKLEDLPADIAVCFMSGSAPERSLPVAFASLRRSWRPVPFTEEDEMLDAYAVGHCGAVAGEATWLLNVHSETGPKGLRSRVLDAPVTAYPILAMSPARDGAWAGLVGWTIYTLTAASRPTPWPPKDPRALPVPLPGLAKDWQARVIAAVGSTDNIFARNFGAGAETDVLRRLNRIVGQRIGPYVE